MTDIEFDAAVDRDAMNHPPHPNDQAKKCVWTLDQIEDEAYIGACELVGPNSCEFDDVKSRLIDEMCVKYCVGQEDPFTSDLDDADLVEYELMCAQRDAWASGCGLHDSHYFAYVRNFGESCTPY